MNLVEKIMAVCPDLTPTDFLWNVIVQNDGDGDYIAQWNHPTLERPTPEQLEAAEGGK